MIADDIRPCMCFTVSDLLPNQRTLFLLTRDSLDMDVEGGLIINILVKIEIK